MKKRNFPIVVDGKEYPCRPTMGAMLRFKQETGRDVSEMTGSVSDLATYMWCCVVSACKREGVEFNMSLMDFADAITEADMNAWAENAQRGHDQGEADAEAEDGSNGKKK